MENSQKYPKVKFKSFYLEITHIPLFNNTTVHFKIRPDKDTLTFLSSFGFGWEKNYQVWRINYYSESLVKVLIDCFSQDTTKIVRDEAKAKLKEYPVFYSSSQWIVGDILTGIYEDFEKNWIVTEIEEISYWQTIDYKISLDSLAGGFETYQSDNEGELSKTILINPLAEKAKQAYSKFLNEKTIDPSNREAFFEEKKARKFKERFLLDLRRAINSNTPI